MHHRGMIHDRLLILVQRTLEYDTSFPRRTEMTFDRLYALRRMTSIFSLAVCSLLARPSISSAGRTCNATGQNFGQLHINSASSTTLKVKNKWSSVPWNARPTQSVNRRLELSCMETVLSPLL